MNAWHWTTKNRQVNGFFVFSITGNLLETVSVPGCSQSSNSTCTHVMLTCIRVIDVIVSLPSMNSNDHVCRVFGEIAAAVSDKDKAVRAACLSTLTTVYDYEGRFIWKLVGPVPSQQKSLIEERFKSHHKALIDKGLAVGHRGSRPSTPMSQPSRLPTPDGARRRRTTNLLDSGSTANGDFPPRPPSAVSGRSLQSPMPLPDPPEIELRPNNAPIMPPPDLPPGNLNRWHWNRCGCSILCG